MLIEGRRVPATVEQTDEPQPGAENVSVPIEADPFLPPVPDFELVGIAISGEGASALIRRISDDREVWLKQGESLDGWMLAEISQQAIRLEAGNAKIALQLFPQELP